MRVLEGDHEPAATPDPLDLGAGADQTAAADRGSSGGLAAERLDGGSRLVEGGPGGGGRTDARGDLQCATGLGTGPLGEPHGEQEDQTGEPEGRGPRACPIPSHSEGGVGPGERLTEPNLKWRRKHSAVLVLTRLVSGRAQGSWCLPIGHSSDSAIARCRKSL